jgi:tartrate dehydrogenase/decarboxylase / D-malate dehydrogenase
MKEYKIAAVPGDGIGNEIVPPGLQILHKSADKFNFKIQVDKFDWGAGYYKKHGDFMPSDGLDILNGYDAIYFGAVGLPDVDDTLPAMMYTFKVRTHFKQYINLRPVKLLPGIESPLRKKGEDEIDFVIIRENNEGEFVQNGKIIHPDEPHGLATDTSVFTRKGIEQVAHYAFKLAQTRKKRLTNVTKSNTLINSLAYWDRVIGEVAVQYPDVDYNKMYVDNASASFVLRPEIFDVILTTNMIGDILSDLGGAIMGSLGLGPSGNINPEKEYPSMFEPIHGSAPDIAGQNVANPIGTIWSGALLLDHLGEKDAAFAIVNSIKKTTAAGLKTRDLGGDATTVQVAEMIMENMEE